MQAETVAAQQRADMAEAAKKGILSALSNCVLDGLVDGDGNIDCAVLRDAYEGG
jgi:hypothetical protein